MDFVHAIAAVEVVVGPLAVVGIAAVAVAAEEAAADIVAVRELHWCRRLRRPLRFVLGRHLSMHLALLPVSLLRCPVFGGLAGRATQFYDS